jgi:hypothetical protein
MEPEPEFGVDESKVTGDFHDITLTWRFKEMDEKGGDTTVFDTNHDQQAPYVGRLQDFPVILDVRYIYIVYQGTIYILTSESLRRVILNLEPIPNGNIFEFSLSRFMHKIHGELNHEVSSEEQAITPNPHGVNLITLEELRRRYQEKRPHLTFISHACRPGHMTHVPDEIIRDSKQDDPSLMCYLKDNYMERVPPDTLDTLHRYGILSKSDLIEVFMDMLRCTNVHEFKETLRAANKVANRDLHPESISGILGEFLALKAGGGSVPIQEEIQRDLYG